MKYKLLNRAIQKQAKKHPRESRFVTYEKAGKILLLFNSNGKDESIHTIIKQLKQDGKNVTAWGFSTGKPAPDNNPTQDVHIFYKRDTGLFQKPKKRILQEVNAVKYDLLINLSLNHSVPLLYLSLLTEASLKAGRKTELRLFDFMLDVNNRNGENLPADEQYLFNEIIFYLKSIQTTD